MQTHPAAQGPGHLADRPLRGRLRRDGLRDPRERRGVARNGQRCPGSDRPRALGGKDAGGPHRHGASTSSASTFSGSAGGEAEAIRLHLPVQEGRDGHQGEGADAHAQIVVADAVGLAAPAQPGAARLGGLLPTRGIQAHVQLSRPVRMDTGRRLAAQAISPHRMGQAAPTLPTWVASHAGRDRTVNPATVAVTRYRYRGNKIPNPWTSANRPSA